MRQGIREIITPEGVTLQFETAGIGARFLAMAIDTIIQMVVLTLLVAALVLTESYGWEQSNYILMAIFFLVSFALTFGYFILFELLWGGQTPGKRWMQLRVVQVNGAPAGILSVFMRNLLRVVDMLPLMYLVGMIAIFIHPQERRIGDLVAGTMVVKEFKASQLGAKPQHGIGSIPADIQMSAQEIQTLQAYFQREKELNKAKREQLQSGYINYFKAKYDLYPQAQENPHDFLKALLMQAESPREPEPAAMFPDQSKF